MLDPGTLATLRDSEEVRIRTTSSKRRGVIIWIVVVGNDVFVRSFHGPSGQWFVAATADGHATLLFDERELPVRVTPVTDAHTIKAVSEAVLSKYASSPYSQAMVAPATLPTTLRLDADN